MSLDRLRRRATALFLGGVALGNTGLVAALTISSIAAQEISGVATWTGSLTLPSSRTPGQYRIVIEQFEEWRTDGSAQAWRNLSDSERESARGERLVHQDILWV